MSVSNARERAHAFAADLHEIGPVEITRFFGGAGLAIDGRQFGFVVKDSLYLRVDEHTRSRYEQAGSQPFQYHNGRRQVTVGSYYQVPPAIASNPDALGRWAADAAHTAARTATRRAAGGRIRRGR